MLTIFFDINGLLILVFKDHDITINTQHQQQEKKHPGMFMRVSSTMPISM